MQLFNRTGGSALKRNKLVHPSGLLHAVLLEADIEKRRQYEMIQKIAQVERSEDV
jgi:hypothetical protein